MLKLGRVDALVIRTLPNTANKRTQNYSGNNPVYYSSGAMEAIVSAGIQHLLIDLPSVDKEDDGGAVRAHHIFWEYPTNPQLHKTITEMIFVPDNVSDGYYVLDIQIAPFDIDASPSRPILYPVV